jgi:LPS sulfotransferase NodH
MAQAVTEVIPTTAANAAPRRFVIYGSMRTGSNYLVSLLNQFPGVVCHGEVFNPNFVGLHPTYARNFRIPRKAIAKRDRDSEALYERLVEATPQETLVGFKIFPGHDRRILEKTLSDTQVRKIILRRNIVESFISLCQAEQSEVWMISRNDKETEVAKRRRALKPITFDASRFLKYKNTVDAFHKHADQKLAQGRHEVMRLEYEDLLADDASTRISAFLGLTPLLSINPSPLTKINSSSILERATNPSEMTRFLHKYGLASTATSFSA